MCKFLDWIIEKKSITYQVQFGFVGTARTEESLVTGDYWCTSPGIQDPIYTKIYWAIATVDGDPDIFMLCCYNWRVGRAG